MSRKHQAVAARPRPLAKCDGCGVDVTPHLVTSFVAPILSSQILDTAPAWLRNCATPKPKDPEAPVVELRAGVCPTCIAPLLALIFRAGAPEIREVDPEVPMVAHPLAPYPGPRPKPMRS